MPNAEEILNPIDDEPKSDIPDEDKEEKSLDILGELNTDDEPEDDLPDPRVTDPVKNSENIIGSELKRVALGEKDLDDVPDWCREEVKTRFDAMKEARRDEKLKKVDEALEKVSKFEERMLSKDKEEDKKTASAILDSFLENSGLDREEFIKEHKKEFLEKVKEEESSGSSRTKAVKLAIGELYASGIVPSAYEVSIDTRRTQGAKYFGGGDSTRSVPSRELDEMNRELARFGVTPVSKETFQKMKEQGLS